MKMPSPRHAAFHANQMAFARHAVTHFHGAHVRAHFNYAARKFMAHNHRHRNGFLRPFIPFPNMQVRTANPRFCNPNQNIVNAKLRRWLITKR